ncbi:MAG: SprB repeat-containing protein, partial [Capnocytophaga sp.]|uniref:SprB repeat-containing protein n=1 Tax=Capnocytophaga sp. TaxID=44737 RepID=UPI003F9EDEC1
MGWNLYFVAGQKDLIATKVGWWNGSAMFPNDHTNPTDNSSRFLAVDFGELIPQGAVFYEKDVQDVLPNQPIEFEMFGFNLVKSSACVRPVMIMEVVALDYSGNVVIEGGNEKILGRIESEEIPGNGGDGNAWFRFASDGTGVNTGVSSVVKVNPGTYKRLKIRVRTKHNTRSCNDFAFDDLTVYQSPISCSFTQSVTVQIVDGKQFGVNTSTEQIINAKCRDGQGQYRIQLKNLTEAQYWYSVNGAAFVASTPGDNSFVWNGYAGNYTVRFRATATSTDCEVTRLFTITQPNLINLSIEGNSVLGCTPPTTGVHSITAQGGTPPYTFYIYNGTATLSVIAATVSQTSVSLTFTQTGSYRIVVADANACRQEMTTPWQVYDPKTLVLAGTNSVANNNYCTQVGAKGKVEVRVSTVNNGNHPLLYNSAPYSYLHNGNVVANNVMDTSYIFQNLNVGTHTFTVVDRYGCTATHTTEISLPLRADGTSGVVVSKDITCETSPNNQGKLTLKVKDGYPPYSYIVKNSGGLTIQGERAVPSNREATFETASYGVYTIKVTDSKGCSIEGTATLTQAVAPTITYTTTSVNCYGGNDGTISLTLSGGQAPYTVYLDGVNKGTTNSQLTLTGLSEKANYVVKVVDARSCDKSQTIAVVQPTAPLRAFAVVDKLVGCEKTGANKDKAKVRFTNVTGGSGDYRYKFDGNFDIYKEGWLPAGTHTITVKDKNGCEYPVIIKVDSRIAAPTATTYTITTYDCSGKATVEFTGSPNNYNYKYKIDGKTATGTTATITGLVPGSYTVTIEYTLQASLDSNLLFFEDFGKGAAECLPSDRTGLPCGNSAGYHQITNYTAGSTTWYNIPPDNCSSPKIWVPVKDHTSGGTDPLGRFFIADSKPITADGELFYKRKITDLKPNSNIKFEFYVLNLFREDRKHHATYGNALEPNLQVRLVANDGVTVVGTPISTGKVPNSVCGAGMANWHLKEGTLNVGTHTEVTIEFRSNGGAPHVWGNDFALDDIKVYQMPESCPQSITKTVVVPSGEEF